MNRTVQLMYVKHSITRTINFHLLIVVLLANTAMSSSINHQFLVQTASEHFNNFLESRSDALLTTVRAEAARGGRRRARGPRGRITTESDGRTEARCGSQPYRKFLQDILARRRHFFTDVRISC